MSDPSEAVWSALHRESGFAVLYYPDLWLRGWVESEARSLGEQETVVVNTVDEALRAPPDHLVLLLPADEAATVRELDGARDRFLPQGRTAPVVILLLRDGPGARALREDCPSLWSVVAGSDPDPDALAAVDGEEERRRFEDHTGLKPEAWLEAWERGELSRDADAIAVLYDALLLAGGR